MTQRFTKSNHWILQISSLRIGREQHVPDSSNDEMCCVCGCVVLTFPVFCSKLPDPRIISNFQSNWLPIPNTTFFPGNFLFVRIANFYSLRFCLQSFWPPWYMQSRSRGKFFRLLRFSRLRRGAQLWTPAEEMADFEEAHAPGGPLVEATVSRARKVATENTPMTPPPKKTRTAVPADAAHREAQSSQAQRLSARAMMNPKDTELLALSQRACASIPAFASS